MTTSEKGFSISNFALDKDAVRAGIWMDIADGLRLRVARISSPDFEAHMRRTNKNAGAMKRFRQSILESDEDTLLETTIMEGMAKHILLDWENLQEDDGVTPIVYSWEKALSLFQDYPEFYKIVVQCATDYDGYRKSDVESAAKNSGASSSGTKSGEATPQNSEMSTNVKASPSPST